ncbi:hypothetical protein HUO13_32790 [Saccharopolyspora erythraea]|uniref:hypothetical protein n=1 Tax=Saccharopolyspora erythraea TaxID=1836 RepID=UPI001BABB9AD|nr:hypothetical protein [Saccharopolyspora erythraea]QUH04923.1 hypothetical protein HUO13_32790 [Saccharopolyspora erythraea]
MLRAEAEQLLGGDELAAALEDRRLVELWPGVVLPAALEHDPRTRARAALLRAGPAGVLSGATAAAMHGCVAAAGPVIHVTIPYYREKRSVPGLTFHQAWIREEDVVELDGLRVHALDVAIADLLCTGPQRMALACLEQALAGLGERGPHFRALVEQRLARRRDRRGTRQAAALLELAWTESPGRQLPSQEGGLAMAS